jgi:cell wall-associated NlpC family hydrolase
MSWDYRVRGPVGTLGCYTRKGSGVLKGRRIVAFLAGAMVLALASSIGASQSYTVGKGDSLWEIARRFDTSIYVIKTANNISSNKPLQLGARLTIPTSGDAQVSAKASPANTHRYVSVAKAMVRASASTSAKRLASLQRGASVQVLSTSGNWSRVVYGRGRVGWIYNSLLCVAPPEAKEQAASGSPRDSLIRTALANRGARYHYGGTSRGGFDCSGFTRYIFAKHGVSLPHSSRAQYSHGKSVSRDQLQAGDLVFFHTTRRGISHVGIFIGNGRFVHASNRSRGVVVDSLGSAYYSSRYVGARRVN